MKTWHNPGGQYWWKLKHERVCLIPGTPQEHWFVWKNYWLLNQQRCRQWKPRLHWPNWCNQYQLQYSLPAHFAQTPPDQGKWREACLGPVLILVATELGSGFQMKYSGSCVVSLYLTWIQTSIAEILSFYYELSDLAVDSWSATVFSLPGICLAEMWIFSPCTNPTPVRWCPSKSCMERVSFLWLIK